MKELSIEEKAKAYDEAKINGSRLWECDVITRENYEYMFPELKESEDERIRKALITIIGCAADDSSHIYMSKIDSKRYIAWLEKQGEKKSISKILVSEKLYEHIRNICACIDDAMSSESIFEVKDYLGQASKDAQDAFDMIEKQGEKKSADKVESNLLTVERAEEMSPFMRSGFENESAAWSEEDESWFKEMELMCLNFSNDTDYREKFSTWLKSLKERCTSQSQWKPTDEQINVLWNIVKDMKADSQKEIEDVCVIMELFEQLKALCG